MTKTLVLLSGGIDSTVTLANAIRKGHDCTAITFDYGQTHAREINAAAAIARYYNIPHTIRNLTGVFTPDSALTATKPIPEHHAETVDATYVPARNILMLAISAAHAENTGANTIAIGANADDHAGYPDCRPMFLTAMDKATRLGTLNHIGIWTPLIGMTKEQIIRYGFELRAPLGFTWSCYRGGDQPCGNCGPCESIAKAGTL